MTTPWEVRCAKTVGLKAPAMMVTKARSRDPVSAADMKGCVAESAPQKTMLMVALRL